LVAAFALAGCSAGHAPAPGDGPARPASTVELRLPRAVHTATLLSDGRVLVAGGCTRPSCEMAPDGASAELYAPTTGSFRPTGGMRTERSGHTATLLPGGRVLIAGGWDRDGVLATAELYDPASGAFTPTGSLRQARGGATATLLADGTVLVAGGFDGARMLAGAERYDPRGGAFSPAGRMTVARAAHSATALPDGRVLVAGGTSARDQVAASAEVYDPARGAFTPTGSMAVARHKHAAVGLRGGTVLVVGGSDERDLGGLHASAEVYDPATGRFHATGPLRQPRYKLPDAAVLLGDGMVLVAGGGSSAELYDPGTGAFRPAAALGVARWFATATRLHDGAVLIFGGYDAHIDPSPAARLYRVGGPAAPGRS
jgi:hypothetical protein